MKVGGGAWSNVNFKDGRVTKMCVGFINGGNLVLCDLWEISVRNIIPDAILNDGCAMMHWTKIEVFH